MYTQVGWEGGGGDHLFNIANFIIGWRLYSVYMKTIKIGVQCIIVILEYNITWFVLLQDFEALTPNLLARTIETVEGGGVIVILLKTMASLKQLYTMTMVTYCLKIENFKEICINIISCAVKQIIIIF